MNSPSFVILAAALVLCAMATFTGGVAPFIPATDLLNDFRPYLAVACTLVLLVALVCGFRRIAAASTALFLFNAALTLAASFLVAPQISSGSPFLKVATLNTWIDKNQAGRILAFVERTRADVILLQEIGAADRAELLPGLRSSYPYILFDETKDRSPAILAKRPWTSSGFVLGATDHPVAVWARFERNGTTFDAVSVHTANPFRPAAQARDIQRLIEFFATRDGPVVAGGDFNLTPFSWGLTRLALQSGLRWGHTFSASWPARRYVPVVLLDHILVRGPLGIGSIRTASSVGSDHLPVVGELRLRSRAGAHAGGG